MIAGVVSYMLLCWGGGGFGGLVIPTYSPYSSELLVPDRGLSASRVVLSVRVRWLGAFCFLWERVKEREM